MATLTITAKGQVTLKKEVLRHMGVSPGGKVEIEMLPGGCASFRAVKREGRIEDLFGLLAGKTNKTATLDEMDAAIRKGRAKNGDDHHRHKYPSSHNRPR